MAFSRTHWFFSGALFAIHLIETVFNFTGVWLIVFRETCRDMLESMPLYCKAGAGGISAKALDDEHGRKEHFPESHED